MIEEGTKYIHWNYFLALENDTEEIARYVDFTKANFPTYSIELAHLLLAASSEIDVVAKQLCSIVSPSSKAENIDDYRKIINPTFPVICTMKIVIPRFSLTLHPWDNWQRDVNPNWWKAYNNVKHQRHEHFSDANLKNALNALSGLYILLLFMYKDIAMKGELFPNPQLVMVEDHYFGGMELIKHMWSIRYRNL